MTEFARKKPDHLAITAVPTDEQIAEQMAQGMTHFSTVGGGRRVVYRPDQVKPRDIAFVRYSYRTAASFQRVVDEAMKKLEAII